MSLKNNSFYVYVLINPITNLPFYVGKGKNNRDISHITHVKCNRVPNGNKHLYYTIKNIIDSGYNVIINRVIQDIDENQAFTVEKETIKNTEEKI